MKSGGGKIGVSVVKDPVHARRTNDLNGVSPVRLSVDRCSVIAALEAALQADLGPVEIDLANFDPEALLSDPFQLDHAPSDSLSSDQVHASGYVLLVLISVFFVTEFRFCRNFLGEPYELIDEYVFSLESGEGVADLYGFEPF